MNKKLVAIDCGKAETKVYAYDTTTGKITSAIVRSRVSPSNPLVKVALNGANVVAFPNPDPEMEGEWIVGALDGAPSHSNSKKDHIHKILTLTAIALVTENGDSVTASVGCPLSVFSNDAEKHEYYDYIFPDGRVNITLDGQERYFYIEKDKCMVFPESFGALFLYEDRFSNKTGVVDIGGLNVNASYFLDKKLAPFYCTTEKLGYYSLVAYLRSRLNAKCDAGFDDTTVDFFIRQGYVTNMKETARDIEEAKELHVERIGQIIDQWDLTSSNLVFIGGTAELLKKYIEKQYGKRAFIPEEANLINCRGFLRAMLMCYGYNAQV